MMPPPRTSPPIVLVGLILLLVLFGAGCGSSDVTAATTTTLATVNTLTAEAPGLYPVSVEGKWGYIDGTGAIKIQPQYELAGPFSEGLTMARLNGKWGYIDASGTMVIPPQFNDAHPFSNGLATVGKFFEDGPLFGFVDKTGAMVIEPEFTLAGDFSEGLAGVMSAADDSRRGYIDKNGDWVIELPGNLIAEGRFGQGGFSEGLAVVRDSILDDPEDGGFRYGYVDTSGAVIIKPQFTFSFDFSEGLAAVAVKENGATKWGYIDKTGTVVIPMQYQTANTSSGGLARVENWARVEDPAGAEHVSTSYIDKTGKVIWQGE